jgi:hypothetical protein
MNKAKLDEAIAFAMKNENRQTGPRRRHSQHVPQRGAHNNLIGPTRLGGMAWVADFPGY